jgi:hypothetical protein
METNTRDAKMVKASIEMYDWVMVQMEPLVVHMLQMENSTGDVKMVNPMTGTLPQMGLDVEMTSAFLVAHHWMIVKLVTQQ